MRLRAEDTEMQPEGDSMTDIPAELMQSLIIPISAPHNYVLVRGVVNRYNAKTGCAIDPITVSETLNAQGYNIVGIPARKIAIVPTDDGLVLDKEQILQIIAENQLGNFPRLELAVQNVLRLCHSGKPLKTELDRVANSLTALRYQSEDDPVTPRDIVAKHIRGHISFFDMSFGESPVFAPLREVPTEEKERVVQLVVDQAMFLFDTIDNDTQLVTKEMRDRYVRRVEEMQEEDRQARNRKREELFASVEATERWLFGMARHSHREAKRGVEEAAQEVAKNDRARRLIAHHSIDLFVFVSKQIEALGDDRERTREIGRIEAPLAVLLTAFAKPRTIDASPHVIRKDPGDYVYRLLSLWLDAKFVSELPDGAYADVMRNEGEYQERHREKTSDYMRRSSWGSYQDDEMDSFFKDLDKDDQVRSERHLQAYEASRAAMLWWKCPMWLKYKILRRHIGDALYHVRTHSRGFTGKQFVEHVEALIAHEERVIKQQNTLLGTIVNNDMASLDRYLKELTKDGPLSDEMMNRFLDGKMNPETPTTERAEEIVAKSEARIRALKEMRDAVHLDFVMTPSERDAEIERRKRERNRFSLSSFRGFGGGLRW